MLGGAGGAAAAGGPWGGADQTGGAFDGAGTVPVSDPASGFPTDQGGGADPFGGGGNDGGFQNTSFDQGGGDPFGGSGGFDQGAAVATRSAAVAASTRAAAGSTTPDGDRRTVPQRPLHGPPGVDRL